MNSPFRGKHTHTLSISGSALPEYLGQPLLHPVRLSGTEGLNSLFEYELLLKTPEFEFSGTGRAAGANIDLDGLIGREINCTIQLDGAGTFVPGRVGAVADHLGAGERQINAIVTDARMLGEEGRHFRYALTLRPWLHRADLRSDCKVFQNQTVVETLDELLGAYTFPVVKRLVETYPVRDYQTQLNETDFAFFERLCQEWGINYFFEHSDGAHRLVLIDNMGAYKAMPSVAYQTVDYHPPGWKTDAEYLHAFACTNRLTSGGYATRDYDYTRPRADLSISRHDPRPTGLADGEIYEWHADQAASHYAQPRAGSAKDPNDPHDEGRQFARMRVESLRGDGQRAQGQGNLRGMVPGHSFKLHDHPRNAANIQYLLLQSRLVIEDVGRNSQPPDAHRERGQQWHVQVDLTAHPTSQPLRPEPLRSKPLSGPQTALVVGPEGKELWTDELGRIKVQFPWDRLGQKNQRSSCWVRVSSPWAGNQLGGVQIPRIGQEVVIDFIGNDPDLPICTGRVHNQNNLPPWSLPGQAALSGFRSRELTPGGGNASAGRSNHLLLDDTEGRIQAQLKSDHKDSSLALGHIARVEDHQGRKDQRGEGFELRTDAQGVVRAHGMLVTTEPRPRAQGAIKAMAETLGRLTLAREQQETLAELAQQAGAQQKDHEQSETAAALKAQNAEIKGDASGDFPEFSQPHLVWSSPAGIAATTAGSTHLHSADHTAITTGKHLSFAVQGSWHGTVNGKIAFVASKDVALFSRHGPVRIEAQSEHIELVAQKVVEILSNDDWVHITGKKGVQFNGDGSYIRLTRGRVEIGCEGEFVVHSASSNFTGPKSAGIASREWADTRFDDRYVVRHPRTNEPQADVRYRLTHADGSTEEGVTDAAGRISMQKNIDPASLRIKLLGRRR
ncbi:type VI secretion system tip protein TssI/VgrG [Variovorax humicola]|uniref:Type VI secretion system tip protein TssI/VgrG n=1 Tax=Variovorax humicola TaxID=1769758 RepID=A0ABU8VVB6_9BURK